MSLPALQFGGVTLSGGGIHNVGPDGGVVTEKTYVSFTPAKGRQLKISGGDFRTLPMTIRLKQTSLSALETERKTWEAMANDGVARTLTTNQLTNSPNWVLDSFVITRYYTTGNNAIGLGTATFVQLYE